MDFKEPIYNGYLYTKRIMRNVPEIEDYYLFVSKFALRVDLPAYIEKQLQPLNSAMIKHTETRFRTIRLDLEICLN